MSAFPAKTLETELGTISNIDIEKPTLENQTIEYFQAELTGHHRHYVYDIASSAPLYQETIGHVVEATKPLQKLGITSWASYSADYF